jgi:hypothetical protein
MAKSGSKFGDKYRDKVGFDNEREKARGSSYGHLILPRGVKMFQVAGGDRVRFDILPYEITDEKHMCRNDEREVALPGSMWYRKPYKMHRNVGASNESVVCLDTFKKRCPICEYRAKLVKEKKESEEEIKSLRASLRNLYVVVPIKHKEYDEVIHIFDISGFNFQDMLSEETTEKPEFRVFFDPSEEGFTISARFSEEKLGKNKYAAISRIDFEERSEGYDEDFLKKVPNLDEMLQVLTYKEIEAKFFELDEEASDTSEEKVSKKHQTEEEEEEERPRKSHKEEREEEEEQSKSKRKVKADEEEEIPHKSSKKSMNECPACEGSGEDSKGKECHICKGTGIKRRRIEEEEEPEEKPRKSFRKDEEEEEPEEKPRSLKRKSSEPEKKSGKCPSGHKFGEDCDEYPKNCSDCPMWDDCFEVAEQLKK